MSSHPLPKHVTAIRIVQGSGREIVTLYFLNCMDICSVALCTPLTDLSWAGPCKDVRCARDMVELKELDVQVLNLNSQVCAGAG